MNSSFSAVYGSSSYSLLLDVTSQSQTISVANLTNMYFVPNGQTIANLPSIAVYTVDSSMNMVANNTIDNSIIIPTMVSSA